jgi:hypothetical protein
MLDQVAKLMDHYVIVVPPFSAIPSARPTSRLDA